MALFRTFRSLLGKERLEEPLQSSYEEYFQHLLDNVIQFVLELDVGWAGTLKVTGPMSELGYLGGIWADYSSLLLFFNIYMRPLKMPIW